MINPLAFANRAKGPRVLARRTRSIARRYGLTPARMGEALQLFARTLARFDCGASFPITAIALKRNSKVVSKYLGHNIEFAVHGYTHIDYSQIAPEEQLVHLQLARRAFQDRGVSCVGFRSPYLRRDADLYHAIAAAGFSYASNQPVLWDAVAFDASSPSTRADYERAIAFYAPWLASQRLSVPRLQGTLVEIPVSLPDDEIVVERLGGATNGQLERSWLSILSQTHQRGELFTLQLHPERIATCANALSAVLTEARTLKPAVWCARLDEIADWWRARATATVAVTRCDDNRFHVNVTGPQGMAILVRGVEVDAPASSWANRYRQVATTAFTIRASCRPFIGVSPGTSPRLADLLRQQGYIVELNPDSRNYSIYFDQPTFVEDREVEVVAQIERTSGPLIRLGRWPNGAKSALAITGDIDALTLWDYGLRFLGN